MDRDIAKINAETAVQKTERDSEKARAEATLATRKTTFNRDVNIAQIEATRATEARDEELRRDVEVKRAQTELERLVRIHTTHVVAFSAYNIYREPVMLLRPLLLENPSNRLQTPRTTRRKLPQTQLSTVSRRPLMPMHIKFALTLRLHISPPPKRLRQLLYVNKRKLQVSI